MQTIKNQKLEILTEDSIELPKDQKWILILKKMKEKGLVDKFKFIYGDKILDKALMFAYDDRNGGIGVKKPDKILLVKVKKEGYWEEESVIGEVDFKQSVDPDFTQSLKIMDLVREL